MAVTVDSLTPRDTGPVLSLWQRVLPLDAITHDTLESRVLLDENFDENTFLVARDDNAVVGFALGMHARRVPLGDHDPRGTRAWITAFGVAPEHQRHGVGTALFEVLFEKFRKLGKRECYVSTYAPGYFTPGIDVKEYPGGMAFLEHRGFEEVYRPLSMDASIVLFKVPAGLAEKEAGLRVEGLEIRPYRREDLLAYLEFMEAEMPADWQRIARSNLRDLTRGLFHPDQILVAVKADEIVGYCQHEGAHFGPFGVSSKYQGKGIGTILLGRTLELMRAKGHHDAWVMWTDDQAAKVYSKFGFKETRRFAVMKKAL